jgi:hypothetical protein
MTALQVLEITILCVLLECVGAVCSPLYWPKYGGDRHVELLDGLWNTAKLGSIEDPPGLFDSMDPNFDPLLVVTKDIGSVPSCVDNTPPGYLGYCAASFFQRRFLFNFTDAGACIQFQACSLYCHVWVNGNEIGDHQAGGYVAFPLDIPPQHSIEN